MKLATGAGRSANAFPTNNQADWSMPSTAQTAENTVPQQPKAASKDGSDRF